MIRLVTVWLALCLAGAAEGKVVINEVSYHPPEENEALEFIELHNTGADPVDLSGWKFTKGIKFEFARGAQIPGKGFLTLTRDAEGFKKLYGFAADGVFANALKNGGENLELSNAQGTRVDQLDFKDDPPWPLGADGESATLERICPEAESNDPANWASSPLSRDARTPAGTPGKQNANYAAALPPSIRRVKFEPRQPKPGQSVTVSVEVEGVELDSVHVVYRVAGSGSQKPEERIAMKSEGDNRFAASIPGQSDNAIVRFQIEAVNKKKSRRLDPGANEPVPAHSYFVHEKFSPAKIGQAYLVHVDEADFKKAEKRRPQRGGPGGPGMSEEDQERFNARRAYDMSAEFSPIWAELCLTQKLSHAQLAKTQGAVRAQLDLRAKDLETLESGDEPMRKMTSLLNDFYSEMSRRLTPILNDAQREVLARWVSGKTKGPAGSPTADWILQRLCNVEGALLYVSAHANLTENAFDQLKSLSTKALEERQKLLSLVMDVMQGRGDRVAVEAKMDAINKAVDQDFGALLPDDAARGGLAAWRENNHPFRMRPGAAPSSAAAAPRGPNALVFVRAEGGDAELFDFVELDTRSGGQKVRFAKGRPFQEMTTINLIFEYNDRFVLAENLAYEVYRKAGNAAPKSEFMRLHVDGRPFGYHLLVEQPNRSFLKRNKIRDDGNLYKILWYESGPVKQHEKKTNVGGGHDDLLALIEELKRTQGEEQWKVIRKNFAIEQVINYFAVNMVLSHWDGYFNNYFTYHDVKGAGKWEMYPWDQDKTWGFHDASGEKVFFDMPVTFGMEGDRPPGFPKDRPPPEGFNGGDWWRPGGYFSKPLLANPQFRKLFLARTREILEDVYTEKNFYPLIDQLRDELKDEVPVRAAALKENPEEAVATFERNLASLKEHLVKRREFLLGQEEIRNAGKFDRAAFK